MLLFLFVYSILKVEKKENLHLFYGIDLFAAFAQNILKTEEKP